MNAAGRHQPQNVTGTLAALQGFDQMADFGVGGEAAIGDGGVNARQFLHDHPAGTDIQVPDLGIAHLSLGQADLFGGGIEQAVRCLGHQAIPDRCVGQADGVVVRRRTVAPAVEDAQDDRTGMGLAGHRRNMSLVVFRPRAVRLDP